MSKRARAESVSEVHRDHRAVKANHPAPRDYRVEDEGRVGKPDERLGRARDRFKVEPRQQTAASVTAARAEDRAHLGIRKEGHQLLGPLAIAAGQNSIARE